MLIISCMLSGFLTKWSFRVKVFSRQVPKRSCRIICTVQYFSNNHYFVFIINANKRTSSIIPFGYGKLMTKKNERGIPPRRNREVKNMRKQ